MHGKRFTKGNGAKGGKPGKAVPPDLLVRLHLKSNPEALTLVRAAMERASELLQFPEHDARAVVRSVDEALANVIRHAYKSKPGRPIDVTCRKLRAGKDGAPYDGLEIILEDSGVSPDLAKLKGRPLDEVRPGGLGLHFIRQSMDLMEFSQKKGKNQLRLVKYLVPAVSTHQPEGE